MTLQSIIECEKRSILNRKNYQLPQGYKRYGLILLAMSLALLFINSFFWNEFTVREISKYGMLLGLLIISISKEKIEDELVINLRMQSYATAFIFGILLAIIHPVLNLFVDTIIDPSNALFKDAGDFVILWILLSTQVLYFHLLLKTYK